MTKYFLFLTALLLFSPCAARAQRADGYDKSDGSYFDYTFEESRMYKKLPKPMRPQVFSALHRRRDLARFLEQNPDAQTALLDGAAEVAEDEDLSFVSDGADMLFVGEYHANPHMLKEVNRLIGQLAPKGFNVLATEFVSSRHQKLMDDFFNGKMTERRFSRDIPLFPEYTVTLSVAREKGLRPLGLEIPVTKAKLLSWGVTEAGIDGRNTYWTDVLKQQTGAGKDRVLVHCGIEHSRYGGKVKSVSLRMKEAGRGVKVLSFINPARLEWDEMDFRDPAIFDPLILTLAKRFKMDKKVLVRVPEKYTMVLGSDYLLYVPPLSLRLRKEMKELKKEARREGRRLGITPQRCLLDPESGMCLK